LFLAFGLALGIGLSALLGRRSGLDPRLGADALFGALLGALVGARALYLLGAGAPASPALWFALGQGGLNGYGALFGACLGGALGLRRHRARPPELGLRAAFPPWFDVAAPGVLLAVMVTRLGCYLQGCDFGRALSPRAPGWLARLGTFPRPSIESHSPVWVDQISRGELGRDSAWTLPVHPTELYEAVGALLLLLLLLAWRPRQRRHGELFVVATLGYSLLRLVTESWRGDSDRGLFWRLSLSQWSAFASAALVLYIFWRSVQRGVRSN
jgi:phosphatidylglycerol:prolipoprotein diacylglycerol transferase